LDIEARKEGLLMIPSQNDSPAEMRTILEKRHSEWYGKTLALDFRMIYGTAGNDELMTVTSPTQYFQLIADLASEQENSGQEYHVIGSEKLAVVGTMLGLEALGIRFVKTVDEAFA
jgi:hypothetical protein